MLKHNQSFISLINKIIVASPNGIIGNIIMSMDIEKVGIETKLNS